MRVCSYFGRQSRFAKFLTESCQCLTLLCCLTSPVCRKPAMRPLYRLYFQQLFIYVLLHSFHDTRIGELAAFFLDSIDEVVVFEFLPDDINFCSYWYSLLSLLDLSDVLNRDVFFYFFYHSFGILVISMFFCQIGATLDVLHNLCDSLSFALLLQL